LNFDQIVTSKAVSLLEEHKNDMGMTSRITQFFMVKMFSLYHHHLSSFLPSSPSLLPKFCWKALWKLHLNHHLKLFLWKMVWNIILTKIRTSYSVPLSNRDATYSLCSFLVDSLYQLFFACLIAWVVWRQSF
jgi:hypothetical protein